MRISDEVEASILHQAVSFTVIQRSHQALAFGQVCEAHRAMLSGLSSYTETLATDDPGGHFEIHFSGEIPPPPSRDAMQLEHFGVHGYLEKNWTQGAILYEQLLAFQGRPERCGIECDIDLLLDMVDPVPGKKGDVSIKLPKEVAENSHLEITFYDRAGSKWERGTRARCLHAMLRDVFPEILVEELPEEIAVIAGARQFSFSQRYQTFTGAISAPLPTNELVEQLPRLIPREWKPRAHLDFLIGDFFSERQLGSDQYFEAWKDISEQIGPIPKGMISLDFVLSSIEGLEVIRAGVRKKRGVPISLGTFRTSETRGALIARCFQDGYRLEIHTKVPADEITNQIAQIVGFQFQSLSQASVV